MTFNFCVIIAYLIRYNSPLNYNNYWFRVMLKMSGHKIWGTYIYTFHISFGRSRYIKKYSTSD